MHYVIRALQVEVGGAEEEYSFYVISSLKWNINFCIFTHSQASKMSMQVSHH